MVASRLYTSSPYSPQPSRKLYSNNFPLSLLQDSSNSQSYLEFVELYKLGIPSGCHSETLGHKASARFAT